jgi:hypothetical protein
MGRKPRALVRHKQKTRARPTPRWLTENELDEIARSRCLLVLSVLSGERPVSEVIQTMKISRQTYYHLETKALKSMLAALVPGASDGAPTGMTERLRALEQKVSRLEREKRRAERLLLLTRQVVKARPVMSKHGRPRKPRSSTKNGTRRLPGSTKAPTTSPATPSIPTPDSETGR